MNVLKFVIRGDSFFYKFYFGYCVEFLKLKLIFLLICFFYCFNVKNNIYLFGNSENKFCVVLVWCLNLMIWLIM